MSEALSALDQAGLHDIPASKLMQMEDNYAHELAAYERLHDRRHDEAVPSPESQP
jgi:hypothetical protein